MEDDSAEETTCDRVQQKFDRRPKSEDAESLVITKRKEKKRIRWTFTNRLCDPKRICVRSNLKFKDLKDSSLLNLRELKIVNATDDRTSERSDRRPLLTDLKFINKLQRLAVLEVDQIDFEQPTTLSLPELQCLEIGRLCSKLKLATANLWCFKCDSLQYAEFEFSEKISHLFVDRYDAQAKQFKELIYLSFQSDTTDDQQLLLNHPKLQALSMRIDYERLDATTYETARQRAMQFLRKKFDLDREELALFFFGIRVKFPFQLTGYEYQDNLIEFQLQNYGQFNRTEVARWIESVNYSCLMRCIEDGIIDDVPETFHECFGQVAEVMVDGPFEQQHLLDFLRPFEHLVSFRMRNCEFVETQFFEKLSTDFPSIGSLSLESDRNASEELADCEFIFEFPNLHRLHSDRRPSLETIKRLFDKYEAFEISSKLNDHLIAIRREDSNARFDLFVDRKFHSDHFDLDALMEKLQSELGIW